MIYESIKQLKKRILVRGHLISIAQSPYAHKPERSTSIINFSTLVIVVDTLEVASNIMTAQCDLYFWGMFCCLDQNMMRKNK